MGKQKSNAKKSPAPSGLSISRSGNSFSCSWKIPSGGYGDGQKFWDIINGERSIGKTVTSKSFTVNLAAYYPSGGVLNAVQFAVKGNKDANTDKWKWSDWVYGTYPLYVPATPSITAERTASRTTKFSYSIDTSNEHQPINDVVIQTVLAKEGTAPNWNNASTRTTTATSGVAYDTPESGEAATGSWTRHVRVWARGPAGNGGVAYSSHTYATPKQASITKCTVKENNASGYDVYMEWDAPSPAGYPIDKTVVEYCIAVPGVGAEWDSGTWTAIDTSHDTSGKDAASFKVDSRCADDQCLFVRVNTVHDDNTAYGVIMRAFAGKLKKPTLSSATPDASDNTVTVTGTNNSTTPDAFMVVCFKSGTEGDSDLKVGVIAHGNTTATDVPCPDWSNDEDGEVFFGLMAVVGTYTTKTRTDGVTVYDINAKMASDIAWSDGVSVVAPTGLTLNRTDVDGSIKVAFNWTWAAANSAELSWADHLDAWESTDEPDTYIIKSRKASVWNIAGLDTGKPWYVRVRLMKEDDDRVAYTPYSDIVSIDLSSAPERPLLALSDTAIPIGGEFTAAWDYVTTDGTMQQSAELAEYSGGTYHKIADLREEQSADIDSGRWNTTGLKYIAVRVMSESNLLSAWSIPVAINLVPKLTCSISATSLSSTTVPSDDEEEETRSVPRALKAMPLTVTVTGAGTGGTTSVSIERQEAFQVDRPDETSYDGYAGETIAVKEQTGSDQMSFTLDDLIGTFDDGAKYIIKAKVSDSYGQVAEDELDFEVHWTTRALLPEAEVAIDEENLIAIIVPSAPEDALLTDKCNIYRLSADEPELIYEGAEFGTKYVDPYPAFGSMGGHRVVYLTADGNYITEDNVVAFYDADEEDGDRLESKIVMIEFGGDKVRLNYDISIQNKWKKDSRITKYLGGSIHADWNLGTTREGSINAVVIPADEEETIAAMRRLSVYSGVCNVRTPEGSSYPADVQVTEDWNSETAGKLTRFSMSIKRADSQRLDGLTYDEWIGGE